MHHSPPTLPPTTTHTGQKQAGHLQRKSYRHALKMTARTPDHPPAYYSYPPAQDRRLDSEQRSPLTPEKTGYDITSAPLNCTLYSTRHTRKKRKRDGPGSAKRSNFTRNHTPKQEGEEWGRRFGDCGWLSPATKYTKRPRFDTL